MTGKPQKYLWLFCFQVGASSIDVSALRATVDSFVIVVGGINGIRDFVPRPLSRETHVPGPVP